MVYDEEILENTRKSLKFRDPCIFEKAVYAFGLIGDLLKYYPELIFKGGTSLLLHVFPPVRFSIDIDILLHEKEMKGLADNLKELVRKSKIFETVEEDVRVSNIPKKHYKFYYGSHFVRDKQYVLLDIVFCEHPYHKIIEKKLKGHPLIIENSGLIVKIPTPEGFFGDKMTAIAPKTTGIPLNEKREMEFVKQVIDLGMLFEMLIDLPDARNTLVATGNQENAFRSTKFTKDETLDDILLVAYKYSTHLLKGANDTFKEIKTINNGLRRVSNHLVERYTQSDLKLAYVKIAYICKLFRSDANNEIVKNIDYSLIEGKRLKSDYVLLEGLKKTNPQAYYYWVLGYGE